MSGPPDETPATRTLRKRQRAWASLVRKISRLELWIDRVVWGLRRRFGRLGPLQIQAFRGFGTAERAVLRGRVLEASVLERSLPADTSFRNFRRMLRRFNSRELPEAGVVAHFGRASVSGRTDDEGYFDLAIAPPLAEARADDDWRQADVEVVDCAVRGLQPVQVAVDVLIPSAGAELGVISDIDDTVLQTHVTQKLKMIWVTAVGSPFTRMPFEGTSELYRALADGVSGSANNPVFYVSKSPWNLYDFLVDFLDFHQLPRGPLLLRDIGLRERPPLDHKSEAVRGLLDLYPALPFVLIGDSGERDADIYVTTAERYPGRVRAIYIRDLSASAGKAGNATAATERQAALLARAQVAGAELLWVPHASVALDHARAQRLVR